MLRLTDTKKIKIKDIHGIQTVNKEYPSPHVFRKVRKDIYLVSWEACIISTVRRRRPDYRYFLAIKYLVLQPYADNDFYYRGHRLRGNVLC